MNTMRNVPGQRVRANVLSPAASSSGSGPVSFVFRSLANGTAEVSLGIDFSKANPPDLTYVADYVHVTGSPSARTISLGKLTSDKSALRTQIEIVFPNMMFQSQLIETSRPFFAVGGLAHLTGGEGEDEALKTVLPEPDKIQTFKANSVMLAAWVDEGVADFYFTSPGDFSFAANQTLSQVRLIGCVRVAMDLPIFKSFLETMP